jgi:hypothetical protein
MDEDALDAELQELAMRVDSPVATAVIPDSTEDVAPAGADSDAERERKRVERNESRKRMAELLSASVNNRSSIMRRPRWRLESETLNGQVSPYTDDAEAAIMPPLQILRSTVRAVTAVRRIESLFLERRAEAKDKAVQVRRD